MKRFVLIDKEPQRKCWVMNSYFITKLLPNSRLKQSLKFLLVLILAIVQICHWSRMRGSDVSRGFLIMMLTTFWILSICPPIISNLTNLSIFPSDPQTLAAVMRPLNIQHVLVLGLALIVTFISNMIMFRVCISLLFWQRPQ